MAAKKTRSENLKNDQQGGAPDQEQDPKRRLGNFTGKGEPPRQGSRAGIVGQTPQKNKTDKKQQ